MNGVPSSLLCCCDVEKEFTCLDAWENCPQYLKVTAPSNMYRTETETIYCIAPTFPHDPPNFFGPCSGGAGPYVYGEGCEGPYSDPGWWYCCTSVNTPNYCYIPDGAPKSFSFVKTWFTDILFKKDPLVQWRYNIAPPEEQTGRVHWDFRYDQHIVGSFGGPLGRPCTMALASRVAGRGSVVLKDLLEIPDSSFNSGGYISIGSGASYNKTTGQWENTDKCKAFLTMSISFLVANATTRSRGPVCSEDACDQSYLPPGNPASFEGCNEPVSGTEFLAASIGYTAQTIAMKKSDLRCPDRMRTENIAGVSIDAPSVSIPSSGGGLGYEEIVPFGECVEGVDPCGDSFLTRWEIRISPDFLNITMIPDPP